LARPTEAFRYLPLVHEIEIEIDYPQTHLAL